MRVATTADLADVRGLRAPGGGPPGGRGIPEPLLAVAEIELPDFGGRERRQGGAGNKKGGEVEQIEENAVAPGGAVQAGPAGGAPGPDAPSDHPVGEEGMTLPP